MEEPEKEENENGMEWKESITGWSVKVLTRFGSICTVFVYEYSLLSH